MSGQLPRFTHNTDAGTNFGLVPFFEAQGQYAGTDHLLAQLYGGSYRSTADRPLFAVQVTVAAVGGHKLGKNPDLHTYVDPHVIQMASGGYEEPSPLPGQDDTRDFIDRLEASPDPTEGSTTETTTWGLSISPSVGTSSAGVGANASYAESKSFVRPDVMVFRHDFDANRDQAAGATWNLIFTKKDGVNRSSFEPRLDLLFQCSKDKLQSGKFRILLVERRLYWGDWAENIEQTMEEARGIGTGVGFALLGPLGATYGFFAGLFVGIAKGNPEISFRDKMSHNHHLDEINQGASDILRKLGQEVGPDSYSVTKTACEIDCNDRTISVVLPNT